MSAKKKRLWLKLPKRISWHCKRQGKERVETPLLLVLVTRKSWLNVGNKKQEATPPQVQHHLLLPLR
jgi:hypothetical protein